MTANDLPETSGPTCIDHPLAKAALSRLRESGTGTEAFRSNARLLSRVLALHVLDDLRLTESEIETPLEKTTGYEVTESVIFVPVLRAGLAMLDAMSDMVPGSRVGFVGLERDEQTAIARSYYEKLPDQLASSEVIVLDPMLATGGSAIATLDLLKKHSATRLRLACIVAAPEGLEALRAEHPDVRVFTASIDRALNEKKYILPGLGDFGDRYFGTD
ncbi:MAG TPA: uracil phosphoribosyltransferase [Acidimicrobiales bacterium]|nr:uracil phosphoribosyltransferase [Acidimicrobiales bacterium]